MKNETKKQKLERILSRAVREENENRIRNLARLMSNKASKYGALGNLYLKKLMKDENKYLAGVASSAYMLATGEISKIKDLEHGGIGYVEKELGLRKIKEFEQEVSYPIEINGKWVVRGEDEKTFYDWDTEKKIKEFKQKVGYPSENKDGTKILVEDIQNYKGYYNWDTGKFVSKSERGGEAFSSKHIGKSVVEQSSNKKSFYEPFLSKRLVVDLDEIKK